MPGGAESGLQYIYNMLSCRFRFPFGIAERIAEDDFGDNPGIYLSESIANYLSA
jgi:hypothetical protein